MDIDRLIEHFNHRFADEQGLSHPIISYDHGQVCGQFGLFRFGSEFQAIAQIDDLTRPLALYAGVRELRGEPEAGPDDALSLADELAFVVNFDRFTRAVHLLNFLALGGDAKQVFLSVHPRHVLSVKRDHGAYFESLVQRCELQNDQVVISVTLHRVYDRQFGDLLDRLRNYRDRGYLTALKFDPLTPTERIIPYRRELERRFTPDFLRLDYCQLPTDSTRTMSREQRHSRWLDSMRSLSAQLVVDGVGTPSELERARSSGAEFVHGPAVGIQSAAQAA